MKISQTKVLVRRNLKNLIYLYNLIPQQRSSVPSDVSLGRINLYLRMQKLPKNGCNVLQQDLNQLRDQSMTMMI